MTGPQHYQYAEVAQDAAAARQANGPGGPDYTPTDALLDALTHAVLALAAATALNDGESGMTIADRQTWRETVGAS